MAVAVAGLGSGVSAISGSCGLKGGGVWCSSWNADTLVAATVALPGLETGVSALSGPCALKDGGVWCWGDNSSGQLGNNSPADSLVPVAVLFPPPSAGDIAEAPATKPLSSQPSTDSADHRTAYVLGVTAAAALALVAASMWMMRRRRRMR